ncbi:MAG: cytochrome c Hsc [Bryobacterales bacterium]|nr:cytochrome c Hsc [Bryobacterales bacterium]
MKQSSLKWAALSGLFIGFGALLAQDGNLVASYTPVDIHESFSAVIARMTAAKPEIMRRHTAMLEQRYDLNTMSPGKPRQKGIRVKPATPVTWDQPADMSLQPINELAQFPEAFVPLPHPHHP